jgi:deazaflavin-dependent oxidoreductase (nitroreductase family)
VTGEPDRIEFCDLTTTGRVSGRPHRIEIWFAQDGDSLYLLAGSRERADWVRNLSVTPAVSVELGGERRGGNARIVEDPDEDAQARRSVLAKYQPGYDGDLTSWSRSSLPVAIDLS